MHYRAKPREWSCETGVSETIRTKLSQDYNNHFFDTVNII